MILVFGPCATWAVHRTVADANSSESGITFELYGTWANNFTSSIGVSSLAAFHSVGSVKVATTDSVLGCGIKMRVESQCIVDVMNSS